MRIFSLFGVFLISRNYIRFLLKGQIFTWGAPYVDSDTIHENKQKHVPINDMNGALVTRNCVKIRHIVVAYFVLFHIASIVTATIFCGQSYHCQWIMDIRTGGKEKIQTKWRYILKRSWNLKQWCNDEIISQ